MLRRPRPVEATGAVAKGLRGRKMQRVLMQFFKPENYFAVREHSSKLAAPT
jgi:hypothetical protein